VRGVTRPGPALLRGDACPHAPIASLLSPITAGRKSRGAGAAAFPSYDLTICP